MRTDTQNGNVRTVVAVALSLFAWIALLTFPARAESCEEKGAAVARTCKENTETPKSLRVKLRMSLDHEDLATAVDNFCIKEGHAAKEQCARGARGENENSLRETLRKALEAEAERTVVKDSSEPAVSGCPLGSQYCYKVLMGGSKCEVRRRDGKELDTDPDLPFYYDGMTSSVYTSVDKCPLEYVCIFYEMYASGNYPGCPKPTKVSSAKTAPEAPASAPPSPAPPAQASILLDPDIEIIIGLPPTSRAAAPSPPQDAPPKPSIPTGKFPTHESTITGIESDKAKQVDPGSVTPTPPERKLDPPKGFAYATIADPYASGALFEILRDANTGKVIDVSRLIPQSSSSAGPDRTSSNAVMSTPSQLSSTITSSYDPITENMARQTVARYGWVPGGLLLEGESGELASVRRVTYLAKANVFILDDDVVYPNPVQGNDFLAIVRAIGQDDRLGVSLGFPEKRMVFGKLPENSKIAMDLFVADGFLGDIVYGYKRYTSGYRYPSGYNPSEVEYDSISVYLKVVGYRFVINGAGVIRRVDTNIQMTVIPITETQDPNGGRLPDFNRIQKGFSSENIIARARHMNDNFAYYARERIWRMVLGYGEAAAFARLLKTKGIHVGGLQ